MLILGAHEFGHYFMCRKYRVPASLPFFIPSPYISPWGTFGAVIRMDSRVPNRKILFDIAAAGPVAGLLVTIPAILIGLNASEVIRVENYGGHQRLGSSLLFTFITYLKFGDMPANYDVLLHPIAFAGWVGLFITAFNLLPIGQLDGGHLVYALFGSRSRWVYRLVAAALAAVCLWFSMGYVLILLILLLIGLKHPPTLEHAKKLDTKRRLLAIALLAFFVVSFTPDPLAMGEDASGIAQLRQLLGWIGEKTR